MSFRTRMGTASPGEKDLDELRVETAGKAHSPTACWEVVVPLPHSLLGWKVGEWRKKEVGGRDVREAESKAPTGREGSRAWNDAGH